MTNKEKYKDKIVDIAFRHDKIALDKNGEIRECEDTPCFNCLFEGNCNINFTKWLEAEYGVPKISIPKDTKKDTLIWVREKEYDDWMIRFFHDFAYNRVTTYRYGYCSGATESWAYAKPYVPGLNPNMEEANG